jgi:hypothetical protein
MPAPIWQPSTTYLPGVIVRPSGSTGTTAKTGQPDNADFESGATGWTLGADIALASDKVFSGTQALKFTGTTTATAGQVAVSTDQRAVVPGQSVTITVYGNTGGNSGGASVEPLLVWYDAAHVALSQSGLEAAVVTRGAWKATTHTATAPAGAAFVAAAVGFIREAGSTDACWADRVSWNYTPPVTPNGLIFKAVQPAAGKSAGTEPKWPSTLGVQVTDNQVIWEAVEGTLIEWTMHPLNLSGATEPTWPTIPGALVDDNGMTWKAVSPAIADPNCPHSKVVAIMASKVFAADGDIVRFSATANALDWSSALNAGYIPTGLQQSNANDMAVLAPYRGNLTAFNASCFQNWQVDPDPAAMAILDQMEGIGSIWQQAAQPVGNELFYLSQLGVRSVSIAAGSDNLQAGDVGMPVDTLVQAALAALPAGTVPRAMYYPGAGQFWLAFPGATTTVYVFTRNAGKGKWSRYVYPFSVDAFAQLGNDCYIRHGDIVSKVDENAVTDEVNGVATNFEGIVQWGWLDLGNPGQTKMLEAFDIVASGNPSVSFGYDQTNMARFTDAYAVGPDSVPGTPIPMPLAAPSLSTKVTFPGGEKWSLQSVTLYVDDSSGQP